MLRLTLVIFIGSTLALTVPAQSSSEPDEWMNLLNAHMEANPENVGLRHLLNAMDLIDVEAFSDLRLEIREITDDGWMRAHPEVIALLRSHSAAMTEILAAGGAPEINFPSSQGRNLGYSESVRSLGCVSGLICLEAERALAAGEYAQAIRMIEVGLHLGDQFLQGGEPLMLHLLGLAPIVGSCRLLERTLNTPGVPPEAFRPALESLRAIDERWPETTERAMRGGLREGLHRALLMREFGRCTLEHMFADDDVLREELERVFDEQSATESEKEMHRQFFEWSAEQRAADTALYRSLLETGGLTVSREGVNLFREMEIPDSPWEFGFERIPVMLLEDPDTHWARIEAACEECLDLALAAMEQPCDACPRARSDRLSDEMDDARLISLAIDNLLEALVRDENALTRLRMTEALCAERMGDSESATGILDPYTGEPLLMDADQWRSIGVDCIDQGGQVIYDPTNGTYSLGDLTVRR